MHSTDSPNPHLEQVLTKGTKLNSRYVIEEELGRGGIGIVYRASDELLVSRPVVIKVLLEESAKNAWLKNKFGHEIEALSRLDHPGIVSLLDKGELPGGQPFLVMQFIKGVTLRSILNGSGLSLKRTASIIRQLGRALTAVHEVNICHRDLKPENIMLQDQGEGEELVKVIDFGIAKVHQAVTGLSTSGYNLVGTPYYMAPEQLESKGVTPVSDIYALGLLAYEMLTGRHPFVDLNNSEKISLFELSQRQHTGPTVWPRQLRSELPADVDSIVRLALAYQPTARYQRARDLGDELARSLLAQAATITPSAPTLPLSQQRLRIVLIYRPQAQPDEYVVKLLEEYLKTDNELFIDRHVSIGLDWAREVEQQILAADVVIPLLSAFSVQSETVAREVEIAHEAAGLNGKPRLLPVRINYEADLPEPFETILTPLQQLHWAGQQEDQRLRKEIISALRTPANRAPKRLEAEGGAVPLESEFYLVRSTDQEFLDAIKRRDSVVLVKGARQMGKTSLLARGLQLARTTGARVILTDMQRLGAEELSSTETLFRALGGLIARKLGLPISPMDTWDSQQAPNGNFEDFLRYEVFGRIDGPLVWGLDEVDRLFSCSFASEVFGLFRGWHNARALTPEEPWPRLTLAMAYATEARLFITDPNQSPFNVGTRLTLADFTPNQVAEMNRRYGAPLRGAAELERFYRLLNGQPYLVRRGLNEMITHQISLDTLEQQASLDEGPFGDHLNRYLLILSRNKALCATLRKLLQGRTVPSDEDFYRLRSAGILSGHTAQEARPRCQLYADYFRRHLR
jgi:serine/threonine protein kinase